MKHRNKRIGLSSDLLTHLKLFNTEWLNRVQISKEMQKGPKGQNGGNGQYLQS
jgi:hypothetical protein